MNALLLVPTRLELDRLDLPAALRERARICGFGPIAAAARTAELLAKGRFDAAIVAGIAGTYDEGAAPVGSAVWCDEVRLDGVGAGEGVGFLSADRLGFPFYSDGSDLTIGPSLELKVSGNCERTRSGAIVSLTVCSASGDAGHAARRRDRFPDAAVEEMEGFGVATAAALAGVPVAMLRGVSNFAGDRRVAGWKIDEALASVRAELISRFAKDEGQVGS